MLFALPAILGLVILKVYPIVASGYYSLTEFHITTPPQWIGFENYKNLLQTLCSQRPYLTLVII